MKNILKFTFIILAIFSYSNANSQDTIKKKNGEVLKVVVKEINDNQIKYYHFDDPNQVLFTIDRMMITDIKFSYGKDYKEKEPIMTDEYFEEDADMAFKVSLSGLWWDSAIFSFEKATDLKSSNQFSLKIFGIGVGVGSNEYRDISGFGLEYGYKLKFGGLKKKKWEYRPDHLLEGGYVMPVFGYNYKSESSGYYEQTSNLVHAGINFGAEKVIQNRMIIDYYAGFAFYAGRNEYKYDGIDEASGAGSIAAGDVFGGNSVALTFGLKVGGVFGTYGKKENKKRR